MTVDPRFSHLHSAQPSPTAYSQYGDPSRSAGGPMVAPSPAELRQPGRVALAIAGVTALLATALAVAPVSAHDTTAATPGEGATSEVTAAEGGAAAPQTQPDGAGTAGGSTDPTATNGDTAGSTTTTGDATATTPASTVTTGDGTTTTGDGTTVTAPADGTADQSTSNTAGQTADGGADGSSADGTGAGSIGNPAVADEAGIPSIVFPVVGPASYVDTFGACRGSGCSRSHKGVDIFAAKLAPLVAAADGVISADRRSAMGISGNIVALTADNGWRYLYIHLNNDAPGTDDGSNPQGWIIPKRLRVGDRVSAGDVIGYVGDSGNAETTPNHVHFEIHQPSVGAINPTPFVQSAREAGRLITVASLASTADGRAQYAPTVAAWYRALLRREPSEMELFAWTDRFDIGYATTDDLIADLTMAKPRRDAAGAIIRAFEVSLDRRPTLNEIRQWEKAYNNGTDLDSITRTLIESAPFKERLGELSDEAFVRAIYQNAVGVDPTDDRLAAWLSLFAEGTPRSALTTYWADSYSVKNSTWHRLEVIQAFRASLDRMPTDEEYDQWVAHLDGGGLIPDVVDAIRTGG